MSVSSYAEHVQLNWETLGQKNGITSEGSVVPNSPLKAFRGTAVIDARIGIVLSVLIDHHRAPEWVDGLEESVELRALANHGVLVWQRFDNPWPVMDRIFIYQGTLNFDKDTQFLQARFVDLDQTSLRLSATERDTFANQSCCVVGKIIHAKWEFWGLSQQATCARVEVIMDPKGWVPAVFVNWFQETWPQRTLAGLRQQVQKSNLPLHPDFGHWSGSYSDNPLTSKDCLGGNLQP